MIASECRQFEHQVTGGAARTWREKRKTRKLRKRVQWEVKIEAMPFGPVGVFRR